MKRGLVVLLVLSFGARADTLITFPDAVSRAMQARGDTTALDERIAALEALPSRTVPVVRAEAAVNSAQNINIFTQTSDRFDAFTTIVAVDYPLFDRGAADLRRRETVLSAEGFRRRLALEREEVFRETLDAYAALYLADRRIEYLQSGAARANELRERVQGMLASGQISNATAATWQDQALASQALMLDLQLQRLDAETRLRQLIGEVGGAAIHVDIDLDRAATPASIPSSHDLEEERRHLTLDQALASRRPQLLLSAFGGIAAVPSTNQINGERGRFGIYGLRFSLQLPMFDNTTARRVAEAQLELDEAIRATSAEDAAKRSRAQLLQLSLAADEKRIALLSESVAVAQQRQESVSRLVSSGVRRESELVEAASDVARREMELLAVRVDCWKLQQTLAHTGVQ